MARSGISGFIADLKASSAFRDLIVHHEHLSGSPGNTARPAAPWPLPIRNLLERLGIEELYAHQAQAVDSVRAGEHTVVSTPTASGKSLIYVLPVLERLLASAASKTLYISPLKALARDQHKTLSRLFALLQTGTAPRAEVYDGDTPQKKRASIRKKPPDILLTNPEMLHLGILPQHRLWPDFLAHLEFVVIDEVHTSRGITGSNMAWVFRRLRRICRAYGADPTFVLCSATVGNPAELSRNLAGIDVRCVTESGAPQGPKHFLFLNPVLSGAAANALHLLHAALIRGLKTIVYCQSRKMTELISMWTKQRLANYAPYITAYRSGFLPEERRNIEAGLAEGSLLAVISTSALELGIDIGELDLCLLVGYPGSVMATWQRGGRVGRKQQESAVILVGHEDSLDQYFMNNPQEFFRLEPEKAVLNPSNPVLARNHLLCAAADLPLQREDPLLAVEGTAACLESLVDEGRLLPSADDSALFPRDPDIQQKVSLRGADRNLQIMDQAKGKAIGDIDHYRACRETHPGAVYLHRGTSYVIQDIDFEQGLVLAKQARVNYFTRIRSEKETEILSQSRSKALGDVQICLGRLRVTERFTGYEKRLVKGQKLISVLPLDLPPIIFETEGLWIRLPARIQQDVESARLHFMGGIHALEHLLIGLLPLFVLTDRSDLGGISYPLHPQLNAPAVFVFDGHPGGVGLASQAFSHPLRLLQKARQTLASCGCSHGCPFCIQSPKCGSGNRPLDKRALESILRLVLACGGTDEPPEQEVTPSVSASPAASPASELEQDSGQSRDGGLRYAVLDLETRLSAQEVGGWFHAPQMGVSCAVLYDSSSGEYTCYWEHQLRELIHAMQSVELVVGFNLLGFDYRVLSGYDMDFSPPPTLDLLREIQAVLGHRLALNNLVHNTLGVSKSGSG
ncbi:MAG: DEAD/DEAH box helicase, partial [Desulfohalobiaceae bacterium]|nr:DEAD/DEAH box helicase [Desulfohalobiaceae bacterium]